METGDDKTSTADNQTVEAASTAAAPSFTEQLIQQVHQIKSDPDSSVVESSLDASVTYKTEVDEDAGQSEEKKSTDDQKEVASEPSSVSDEKKDEKKESDASTTEAKATESAKEPENEAKEEKKEDTINTESSLPSEAVKTVEEKKEAENTEVKDVEQKQEEKETKAEEKAAEDTKQVEQEQKEEQVSTEVKQEATTPETEATTAESNETSVNQLARTVSTSSNGESDAAIAQILLRLQVLLQRQNGIFATPLAAAAKPNAAPIQPPSDILIYNVLKQLLQRYGSTSLPPLNPATQTIVHENDTRQVLQFLHTVINTDTGSSSNDQTLLNNSISLDQVNRVLTHLIEIHQTEQANRPTEDLDPSLIKQVLKLLLQSFASTVAITNARNSNELQFFRCSSCQKVFVQVSYRFNKQ